MIDIDKFLICLFAGIFSLSFLHLVLLHTSGKHKETDKVVPKSKDKLFVKDIKNVKDVFGFDYEHFFIIGPIIIMVIVYLYLVDLDRSTLVEKMFITYLSIILFLQGINPAKTLFSSAFIVFVSLAFWPIYFYSDDSLVVLLIYSFLISIISYTIVYYFHRN